MLMTMHTHTQIQRQGGGIANPTSNGKLHIHTFGHKYHELHHQIFQTEPLYEDVERRRDVINQNYSLEELEDNPAYGKTIQQTRIT